MKKLLFITAAAVCFCMPLSCSISDMPFPLPGIIKEEQPQMNTEIIGEAEISAESARAWAEAHNASGLFISLAEYYWDYGKRTGIRPELMYAQAALETAYGNFGGNVLPEMNNFAGIKTVSATGDKTEDHESFDSPAEGVRAHYNHMCAYIGLAPIGIPHDRYHLALSTEWAGTIKSAAELGGRWCPDPEYGNKLTDRFLKDMYTYQKTR